MEDAVANVMVCVVIPTEALHVKLLVEVYVRVAVSVEGSTMIVVAETRSGSGYQLPCGEMDQSRQVPYETSWMLSGGWGIRGQRVTYRYSILQVQWVAVKIRQRRRWPR